MFNEIFRISKYQIIWGANNFTLPESEYFLVWNKMQTVDNFASAELAYTNMKIPAKVFNYSIHRVMQDRKKQGGKSHPTEKPVKLMEWCILLADKFIDKNGIVNGIKCLALNSSKIPQSCSKDCQQNPSNCTFKRDYLEYLRTLDFEYTLARIENSVKKLPGIGDICLLVHEAPSNPCSERECLKQWFLENDYYLKEWTP